MGLLRSALRGGRELARSLPSRLSTGLQAGAMGAGLGGSISAMGGGSPEDVGRAALQGGVSGLLGGAVGGPFHASGALLGGGLGGAIAGMTNRGDAVDAAARMILQHSPSPEAIPRTAEVLFGAPLDQSETGVGRNGRGNIYGIGGGDQALVQQDAEMQAAVQRAYEMLQERGAR
jgi:hypothetical protein